MTCFSATPAGTYLWSRYHIAPGDCLFIRAGTLDDPTAVTPDVHIFTRTKLPWLDIPRQVPAFKAIYQMSDNVWSAASRARLQGDAAAT